VSATLQEIVYINFTITRFR